MVPIVGAMHDASPNTEEKLILQLGILAPVLSGAERSRREFRARFCKAGRIRAAGNRKSKIVIEPEALTGALAAGLFEGKAVFIDHAGFFEYPSLKNLAGVTKGTNWNETDQAVEGIISFYEGAQPVVNLLSEILAEDNPPDVGLSLVFWPQWAPRDEEDPDRRIVGITHVESVDLVFEPAADGRILTALSAAFIPHGGVEMSQETNVQAAPATTPPQTPIAEEWNQAVRRSAAASIILASGLPAASRERLSALDYESPEAVNQAIQEEQNYLARLAEDRIVQIGGAAPRGGDIQVGMNGIERVRLAAEALLSGTRPQGNVAPLSGIRELYILLSGDYEMTGMFQGERVYLANVNSSTMAGMVANALNKAVVNVLQQYPRWWEPISQVMDFSSLQQVKWITLGGVGELPTVAEGAAYTEMTWDDQTETATFVKKGGYLGLTLEAIDKDDTRKLQAAPGALAQAAWLTLSKAVSNIFTASSGVGPTMSDSNPLFDAAHSNVGSTALSLTSWATVRTAMRKQTELNSGERLGAIVAPKYLVVPPDLEVTALQVLASSHDYTYALSNGTGPAPQNIFAQGNEAMARLQAAQGRVVVVDLWTDTDNWAAVADPLLYPTIGLGFRYGRTPEIFSVASPTAGLMFSNDTLPVKVRYFFAVGPMDWRGMYKQNVA